MEICIGNIFSSFIIFPNSALNCSDIIFSLLIIICVPILFSGIQVTHFLIEYYESIKKNGRNSNDKNNNIFMNKDFMMFPLSLFSLFDLVKKYEDDEKLLNINFYEKINNKKISYNIKNSPNRLYLKICFGLAFLHQFSGINYILRLNNYIILYNNQIRTWLHPGIFSFFLFIRKCVLIFYNWLF